MYVYLLESDGYYKVGISKNVSERISDLQTGNPHPITSIATCKFLDGHTKRLEALLHIMMKSLHISGEWYQLTSEQVALLSCMFSAFEKLDTDKVLVLLDEWKALK